MDLIQLRDYIIAPALKSANLWSKSAEILIAGTCGIESNYGEYIHQIKGPALGIYQMEPATHDDIWNKYLKGRKVASDILFNCNISPYASTTPPSRMLIFNLYYATLMTRAHYLRINQPLPTSNEAIAMAEYYKKYYNTYKGSATIEKAIPFFEDVIKKLGG